MRTVIALVLGLVVASSWLIVPYLARQDLIFAVDPEVKEEQYARAVKRFEYLLHDGPGASDVEVTGFYGIPSYYAYPEFVTDVAIYRPDRYLVFVISEAVHTMDLPRVLPTATLVVDGVEYAPVDIDGPPFAEHHRDTYLRFARRDAGAPIIKDTTTEIELRASSLWSVYRDEIEERSVMWKLPITYPPTMRPPAMQTATMLANFAAGLTAAVAPLLLQLPILFLAAVVGLAGTRGNRPGASTTWRLMPLAAAFVSGLVLLAVVSGWLIGASGEAALAFSGEWNRQVSIAAGILLILLGLWVGIAARAALDREPFAYHTLSGLLGAGAVAVCFSAGGVAGFDGAIAAILIVQLAAAGGVAPAVLAMLVVSAFVAVPLLLATWLVARLLPTGDGQPRYAVPLALASAAVIVAFGVVIAADNVPVLVDLVYPPLGL